MYLGLFLVVGLFGLLVGGGVGCWVYMERFV